MTTLGGGVLNVVKVLKPQDDNDHTASSDPLEILVTRLIDAGSEIERKSGKVDGMVAQLLRVLVECPPGGLDVEPEEAVICVDLLLQRGGKADVGVKGRSMALQCVVVMCRVLPDVLPLTEQEALCDTVASLSIESNLCSEGLTLVCIFGPKAFPPEVIEALITTPPSPSVNVFKVLAACIALSEEYRSVFANVSPYLLQHVASHPVEITHLLLAEQNTIPVFLPALTLLAPLPMVFHLAALASAVPSCIVSLVLDNLEAGALGDGEEGSLLAVHGYCTLSYDIPEDYEGRRRELVENSVLSMVRTGGFAALPFKVMAAMLRVVDRCGVTLGEEEVVGLLVVLKKVYPQVKHDASQDGATCEWTSGTLTALDTADASLLLARHLLSILRSNLDANAPHPFSYTPPTPWSPAFYPHPPLSHFPHKPLECLSTLCNPLLASAAAGIMITKAQMEDLQDTKRRAATVIKRAYKAYQSRDGVRRAIQHYQAVRYAVFIQRIYRGHRQRLRYRRTQHRREVIRKEEGRWRERVEKRFEEGCEWLQNVSVYLDSLRTIHAVEEERRERAFVERSCCLWSDFYGGLAAVTAEEDIGYTALYECYLWGNVASAWSPAEAMQLVMYTKGLRKLHAEAEAHRVAIQSLCSKHHVKAKRREVRNKAQRQLFQAHTEVSYAVSQEEADERADIARKHFKVTYTVREKATRVRVTRSERKLRSIVERARSEGVEMIGRVILVNEWHEVLRCIVGCWNDMSLVTPGMVVAVLVIIACSSKSHHAGCFVTAVLATLACTASQCDDTFSVLVTAVTTRLTHHHRPVMPVINYRFSTTSLADAPLVQKRHSAPNPRRRSTRRKSSIFIAF